MAKSFSASHSRAPSRRSHRRSPLRLGRRPGWRPSRPCRYERPKQHGDERRDDQHHGRCRVARAPDPLNGPRNLERIHRRRIPHALRSLHARPADRRRRRRGARRPCSRLVCLAPRPHRPRRRRHVRERLHRLTPRRSADEHRRRRRERDLLRRLHARRPEVLRRPHAPNTRGRRLTRCRDRVDRVDLSRRRRRRADQRRLYVRSRRRRQRRRGERRRQEARRRRTRRQRRRACRRRLRSRRPSRAVGRDSIDAANGSAPAPGPSDIASTRASRVDVLRLLRRFPTQAPSALRAGVSWPSPGAVGRDAPLRSSQSRCQDDWPDSAEIRATGGYPNARAPH